MNTITIFTATYNRAKLLSRLYNSLVNQTFKDFEWVVVDDGSTDDTEDLITSFINEKKITILFHKQPNMGKHIAINKGLDFARTKWFFIIDSDDYLSENSLSIVNDYISRIDSKSIDGLAFRRADPNFRVIGSKFPVGKNEFVSNMIERTSKYRIFGDMAEIFKTDLLRKCKFDFIEGERFCAEGLMWNRTSKLGANLLFIDTHIYICEYLSGGLTANSILNRRKSPIYASLLYKELSEYQELPFLNKLKAYINYWRFTFYTNRNLYENLEFVNFNLLAVLALPIGVIFKIKDDLNLLLR